jgi:hypothetical protein
MSILLHRRPSDAGCFTEHINIRGMPLLGLSSAALADTRLIGRIEKFPLVFSHESGRLA